MVALHDVGTEDFVLLGRDLCPGVLQDLFGGDTLFWGLMEQLGEEVAGLRRNMIWELQLLRPDMLVELLVVGTLEGELAAEECEEEHSQGPNVGRRSRVLYLAHDFRGHVRRGAAENFNLPLVRDTR